VRWDAAEALQNLKARREAHYDEISKGARAVVNKTNLIFPN
jgi:hypothetical protein